MYTIIIHHGPTTMRYPGISNPTDMINEIISQRKRILDIRVDHSNDSMTGNVTYYIIITIA